MIAEISAGWGSLKAAKEIVQALNGMQTAAAINDVKLTLQGYILEAQQGLFAAQESQSLTTAQISQLEAEIMRLKDWSSERERYELVSVGEGAVAYMAKPEMRGTEPPHWLCTRCFDDGKKSIVQKHKSEKDHAFYGCSVCKGVFVTHWRRVPAYHNATEARGSELE